MSYSLFSRGTSKVILIAKHNVSSMVESLVSPYITYERVSELPENTWTIIGGSYKGLQVEDLEVVEYSTPEEPDCRYFYNGNRKIILIDTPEEDRWIAQHALRLIRVLLRLQCYQEGFIYVHGGLVEINQKGVAFVGHSRAGKTSTILSLLAYTSARYVTNDDIAFQYNEDKWLGYGWPRSMCIRRDTLEAIKPLNSIYRLSKQNHPFNEDSKKHVFIYPKELEEWFKRSVLEKSSVDMLIFPKFLPREEIGAKINNLTSTEAAELLYENMVINPGKLNEFLLPYFELPSKASLIKNLEGILQAIPCYELNQSFQSLDEGAKQIQKLVDKEQLSFI
ncbi:hypothetical protein [Bacillus cereus group sp. N21]|uniref:hypothetical protein n=1 Tax=Bacillus cereus group sp. N21 TaxID=2794591 RepID=UPI0018F4D418|nr:hypothetical protein [Bacillus cereus group sp. N21]MBJ8030400.1 hypothetical protein [Bacillus cereus group sp. N21]